MSQLALPSHVQKRIDLERRAEYWALLKRNFAQATDADPRCQEWTRALRHHNPDLSLIKANDKVEPGVPLRPGCFHLLIIPRDAPPLTSPLMNGDTYAEPGDWMWDVMNRGNLRERRVRDAIDREERDAQAANEKERAAAKEQRMERVKDVVNAATRAQVSMDRSIPWTQNSQGRRPK